MDVERKRVEAIELCTLSTSTNMQIIEDLLEVNRSRTGIIARSSI